MVRVETELKILKMTSKVQVVVLLIICVFSANLGCSIPEISYWFGTSEDVIKVQCLFDKCNSTHGGLVSVSLRNVSSDSKTDIIDVFQNWNYEHDDSIVMNLILVLEGVNLTFWIGSQYVGNELTCSDTDGGSSSSIILYYNGEPKPSTAMTDEVSTITQSTVYHVSSDAFLTPSLIPTPGPSSDTNVSNQQSTNDNQVTQEINNDSTVQSTTIPSSASVPHIKCVLLYVIIPVGLLLPTCLLRAN